MAGQSGRGLRPLYLGFGAMGFPFAFFVGMHGGVAGRTGEVDGGFSQSGLKVGKLLLSGFVKRGEDHGFFVLSSCRLR